MVVRAPRDPSPKGPRRPKPTMPKNSPGALGRRAVGSPFRQVLGKHEAVCHKVVDGRQHLAGVLRLVAGADNFNYLGIPLTQVPQDVV